MWWLTHRSGSDFFFLPVSIGFNAILRKNVVYQPGSAIWSSVKILQPSSRSQILCHTRCSFFFFFLKQGAFLKQVYVTRVIWKPASALSLPLSSHSRADTAITPAVFLLSALMYSRGSPEARLFICIPPGFGPTGFVLIDEISSHEICVCVCCIRATHVCLCDVIVFLWFRVHARTAGNNGHLLN